MTLNRKRVTWDVGGWKPVVFLCLLGLLIGCSSQEMRDNARYKPLEASQFFSDGQSSRPLPADVVARSAPDLDDPVATGLKDGQPVAAMPVTLTADLLEEGQTKFDIYCSPCHGLAGYGDGMIVQRGFPQPPSFHSDRLRQATDGHYFDVISNGFGVMYEYGSRVSPQERWAIIAYIRALQLSQNAAVDDLSPADMEQLNATK